MLNWTQFTHSVFNSSLKNLLNPIRYFYKSIINYLFSIILNMALYVLRLTSDYEKKHIRLKHRGKIELLFEIMTSPQNMRISPEVNDKINRILLANPVRQLSDEEFTVLSGVREKTGDKMHRTIPQTRRISDELSDWLDYVLTL